MIPKCQKKNELNFKSQITKFRGLLNQPHGVHSSSFCEHMSAKMKNIFFTFLEPCQMYSSLPEANILRRNHESVKTERIQFQLQFLDTYNMIHSNN